MIKKYLEISTGNISEELVDYLQEAAWGMEGLNVFEIPDFNYVIRDWDLDELRAHELCRDAAPRELLNLLRYAEENGCELVSIDEHVGDDPSLGIYE